MSTDAVNKNRKPSTTAEAREPLTRERILAAGLALVDREGLEALSMRRVGEALGVEAMSLYNHVPSKAAMLDGIVEVVLSELPAVKKKSSWQRTLRARGEALRKVFSRHPKVLPVFATRPAVTPRSIAHLEATLAVLRDAGFAPMLALNAFHCLLAFVVGHSMASYAQLKPDEDSWPEYAKLSVTAFPHVTQTAAMLHEYNAEQEFALGLDALLVGLKKWRAQ